MFSFIKYPSRTESTLAKVLTGALFASFVVVGGCTPKAEGQSNPAKTETAKVEEHGHAHEAKIMPADTALIMFITRDDPAVAGHALHVATEMRSHGRTAIICLIGDSGKMAVKNAKTVESMTNGESLQSNLKAFIADGGKVSITPFTVDSLGVSEEELIEGVKIGGSAHGIGKIMYKPNTRVFVW